jgi:hypothetical protein
MPHHSTHACEARTNRAPDLGHAAEAPLAGADAHPAVGSRSTTPPSAIRSQARAHSHPASTTTPAEAH